ncbi:hypothetical protein ACJX0J_014524 [Zea mays]
MRNILHMFFFFYISLSLKVLKSLFLSAFLNLMNQGCKNMKGLLYTLVTYLWHIHGCPVTQYRLEMIMHISIERDLTWVNELTKIVCSVKYMMLQSEKAATILQVSGRVGARDRWGMDLSIHLFFSDELAPFYWTNALEEFLHQHYFAELQIEVCNQSKLLAFQQGKQDLNISHGKGDKGEIQIVTLGKGFAEYDAHNKLLQRKESDTIKTSKQPMGKKMVGDYKLENKYFDKMLTQLELRVQMEGSSIIFLRDYQRIADAINITMKIYNNFNL